MTTTVITIFKLGLLALLFLPYFLGRRKAKNVAVGGA
ncbi:MAG: hypothetical protein ACI8UO_004361, partial [Verrucomicrobiales bacterium]